MKTRVECKECSGIQDATKDENNAPVYECRCCGAITPRRINHSQKREDKAAKFEAIIASLIHFN